MSASPDLIRAAASGWESVHLVQQSPDAEALRASGIHVADLDATGINDKQDLMAALADALRFPDYFGANWDALDECLRDLAWIGAEGYVLIVRAARPFWDRAPELAARLVGSWALAGDTWAEKGTPFHLALVADPAR